MKPLQYPTPGISYPATLQVTTGLIGKLLIASIALIWFSSFVIGFETALSVLVFLGFIGAVVGLRYPAIGLLGIGMLCTTDPMTRVYVFDSGGGILRWNTFNYWLLIVMLLHIPFLLRLSDLQSRLLQFLLILMALQILGSVGSGAWIEGVQHLFHITILLGLLIYFARIGYDDTILYWSGVVNGMLAGLGGLFFYLSFKDLPYINPNAWSYFPLMGLFSIGLVFALPKSSAHNDWFLLILAIVNGSWIFLSASRGALLLTLFCFIFILFSQRRLESKFTYIIVGPFIAVSLIGQFTNFQEYTLNRLDNSFNTEFSYTERTSGRSDLAMGAWYIFLDNPLGVGTGGFSTAWAEGGTFGGKITFSRVGIKKSAHSGWMKVLSENGVPGILLLGSYVGSFALTGWYRRKQGLLRLGLLVTFILSVAFLSTEFQGKALWFLAAGATFLLHRQEIIAHLQGAINRTPITNIVRYTATDYEQV